MVPVAPLRCSPGGSRPDAAARAPPSPRDRLALTGDTPHPTGRRRVVPRPGADAARVRESRPGTTCTEGAGAALPRRPGRPVRGGPPRLAVRASQGWRPGAGGRPASPRPLPTSSPPVASGHQARPSSAGHPRRLTYRDPSTVYRLSSTPADESTTSRGRLPPPPTPPDSLPVGSAPGRLGRAVPTLRDGQPAPGDQELRGAEQQVGVHLRVQLERDAGSLHHHIAARRQS